MTTEQGGHEATLESMRKERGDLFWESVWQAQHEGPPLDRRVSGYVHQYEGHGDARQELSVQMRELVALTLLAAKGEHRFAANHVRRLYRMGVTNAVILEAFWAIAPVLGRANLLHAVKAIHTANDPSNHEGELPPGGEPKSLTDFPELHLGEDRPNASAEDTGPAGRPEWQYVARIDPKLAEIGADFYNQVYFDGGVAPTDAHHKAGARELLAITALCFRGQVDRAAEHMRRAVRYGVSARRILEALSATIPMSGLLTFELGAEAMLKAGLQPSAS